MPTIINIPSQPLPSGGTEGQTLVKQSSVDGDAIWADLNATGIELTQAEYDALTEEEKNNGSLYFITDGESAPSANRFSASGISYDNTESGLSATNVQDAVDEVSGNLTGFAVENWTVTNTTGSATKTTVSTLNSRSIDKAKVICIFYVYGNIIRATAIVPTANFKTSVVAMTWVNSANQQFWVEVGYSDDTHITVQTSSNATGGTLIVFTLGGKGLY